MILLLSTWCIRP